MNREIVNAICAPLPGAELTHPWDGAHDVWKVGGKMFASIGSLGTGVSVKTPCVETAQMLIDAGAGMRAKYFHRSWLHVQWDQADAAEMRHRIETSYDIIRAGLTLKFQATLAPRA